MKVTYFLILVLLTPTLGLKSQKKILIEDIVPVLNELVNDTSIPMKGRKLHAERWLKMWGDRAYPENELSEIYKKEISYYLNKSNFQNAESENCNTWNELGPWKAGETTNTNGAGQMHTIAFDPNYNGASNKVMYCGSPFSGIYKSNNAGDTWYSINNDLPKESVSHIEVDPSNGNNIYLTTGDGDDLFYILNSQGGGDLPSCYTIGVYRTTNGGENWEQIFDENILLDPVDEFGMLTRKIKIDPNNSDIAYLATNQGLYKTSNLLTATPDWILLSNFNGDRMLKGLEINHHNSNEIFVSGRQIYRSNDGGLTWAEVNGLGSGFEIDEIRGLIKIPNSILNHDDPNQVPILSQEYLESVFINKINIRLNRSSILNDTYLYATCFISHKNNKAGNYVIARMNIATNNWEIISHDSNNKIILSGFEGESRLAIDINNDGTEIVYGGVKLRYLRFINNQWSSMNIAVRESGSFWDDIHAIELQKNHNSFTNHPNLFVGHDGGISYRERTANSFFQNTLGWTYKNNGLATNWIWSLNFEKSNNNLIVGALQDNGVTRKSNLTNGWIKTGAGGDGYGVAIHKNQNIFLNSSNSSVTYITNLTSNITTSAFGTTQIYSTTTHQSLPLENHFCIGCNIKIKDMNQGWIQPVYSDPNQQVIYKYKNYDFYGEISHAKMASDGYWINYKYNSILQGSEIINWWNSSSDSVQDYIPLTVLK
ncbi:MAG: WD40/YVTN/BNR-like repeat-containing protein [Luteibaculaceae bacterium]